FRNYKTFCPYLVGSYERVGDELAHYVAAGFTTFILDVPPAEEELRHTRVAFQYVPGAYRAVSASPPARDHDGVPCTASGRWLLTTSRPSRTCTRRCFPRAAI